jgi:hypothetical protein
MTMGVRPMVKISTAFFILSRFFIEFSTLAEEVSQNDVNGR